VAKKILLLFLLFFIACSQPQDYSCIKVTEVIDGDTIRLSNGKLLRYIGLDTPEVRIKNNGEFKYDPQPYSLEASEYNRKLVEGKFIRVEFDVDKKDKYGRLLGYCFADDIFVNAKLIEEGYAVLYTRVPNVKYSKEFIEAQKRARRNQKGLWSNFKAVLASQAHLYINQIKAVKGEVISTYESDRCVYLNFGKDWKKDFTVVIFKDGLRLFKQKGINPVEFYKNRIVEVTGRIKEYNGPEIIINSPSQIKIVE